MNRKPTLDELIGADTTGAERQRLQHVHELLLEAGPPPELSPELEEGPKLGMTMGKTRRGVFKQRAMVLLAAAILVFMIFVGGYVAHTPGGKSSSAEAGDRSGAPRHEARAERRRNTRGLELLDAGTGP